MMQQQQIFMVLNLMVMSMMSGTRWVSEIQANFLRGHHHKEDENGHTQKIGAESTPSTILTQQQQKTLICLTPEQIQITERIVYRIRCIFQWSCDAYVGWAVPIVSTASSSKQQHQHQHQHQQGSLSLSITTMKIPWSPILHTPKTSTDLSVYYTYCQIIAVSWIPPSVVHS